MPSREHRHPVPGLVASGVVCLALYNLMEDAATTEISRSQVWQWVRHRVRLKEGSTVSRKLVRKLEEDELGKLRAAVGEKAYGHGGYDEAAEVFRQVALNRAVVNTRPDPRP
jgi:malate synthase